MKKLLSLIACAALLLTGCSKELEVKITEDVTVEYGEELDNTKLFDAKESDEDVEVKEVDGYDAKKLGEQTLKVTFTDGDKTVEKEIKITVEDTKKPEITLKKDTVTITAGDKLTLNDNVKSVKDPVDGDLQYSDEEVKKAGYWIDKGKLDTKTAGTYTVTVKAFDNNGNAAEKEFTVKVKKKAASSSSSSSEGAAASSGSNSSSGNSGSSYASSGTSGSNKGSGGSGSSSNGSGGSSNSGSTSGTINIEVPDTDVDMANHQHYAPYPTGHTDAVMSGKWFNTLEELDAWAFYYNGPNGDWASFQYGTEQCACGMWTPYFFNITYWE